jgi:phosphoribosylformylglycinamidine (FGAM) synthase-like enzyme
MDYEMEDYNMHWSDALSELLQNLSVIAKKVAEILDQEIEDNKARNPLVR